jgi:hypothetical protein
MDWDFFFVYLFTDQFIYFNLNVESFTKIPIMRYFLCITFFIQIRKEYQNSFIKNKTFFEMYNKFDKMCVSLNI